MKKLSKLIHVGNATRAWHREHIFLKNVNFKNISETSDNLSLSGATVSDDIIPRVPEKARLSTASPLFSPYFVMLSELASEINFIVPLKICWSALPKAVVHTSL